MKFKITRDYYDINEKIFEKSYVDIEPGLTVLVGCNGAGKSTLLHQIKEKCTKDGILAISYDNCRDGGGHAVSKAGFFGDFDFLARQIQSSEGENISNNLAQFANKIGSTIYKHPDADKIVVLMDAIDSGLSVDNIIELKEDFFKFILAENKDKEFYFIVSANEYELARGENCFDVVSCKYVEINNYEDYRNLIVETRKKKNKRYGWNEFKYEA